MLNSVRLFSKPAVSRRKEIMNSLVFLLGLCGTAAAQTDVFGWMLNLNFQPGIHISKY